MPWMIIVNTTVLYLFVIVALRLLGKKEIGQLSIANLVFVLLISDVIGEVMRASENTVLSAVIAVITLMLINKLLEIFLYKSKKFNRLLEGSPAVLIRHGRPNMKEMNRNNITIEELEQIGREHGKGDIADIQLAILEVDGHISILDDVHIKSSIEIKE